jgi:hypothetical protein
MKQYLGLIFGIGTALLLLCKCEPSDYMKELDRRNDSLMSIKYHIEVRSLMKINGYTERQAVDSINKWSK